MTLPILRINLEQSASVMIKCNTVLPAEMESRTQGSRPRPRTQKNSRPRPRTTFPRIDTLEADRNARGQGQGPRTQAQVLSKKKKKKGLHKNCSSDLHKKSFSKKMI